MPKETFIHQKYLYTRKIKQNKNIGTEVNFIEALRSICPCVLISIKIKLCLSFFFRLISTKIKLFLFICPKKFEFRKENQFN